MFGAENSSNPPKNRDIVDQFASLVKIIPIFNALDFYAKEKVRLRKNGEMISDFDLLIGATAISNGLIMITENSKEFERVTGIQIENWINR